MRSGCEASNNNHSNRDGRCSGPNRCRAGDELMAGRTTGIRIEPIAMARGPEEVEAAFATISREGAEAVVVQGIFFSKPIAELALRYRLPTASVVRQFAQAGGPSDLPVELPTRFELVLNMQTAKALGIDVPWFFQQRTDEVIE